jgi:hypothetical protein
MLVIQYVNNGWLCLWFLAAFVIETFAIETFAIETFAIETFAIVAKNQVSAWSLVKSE